MKTVIPIYKQIRLDFIDITKGLLMILVVLGHSHFLYSKYIYWFHMPAFFMISGMLHKQPLHIREYLKKRCLSLLIPYFSYGMIISIIRYFLRTPSWNINDFLYTRVIICYKLIFWGGEKLQGSLGVFWFINCLTMTIVVFTLLRKWIRNDFHLQVISFICYVIGYYINLYLKSPLPWDINSLFFTFTYFTAGYYCREIIQKIIKLSLTSHLLIISIGLAFIYFSIEKNLNFRVDLKFGDISHPLFGIIIPLYLTLCVFLLCSHIKIKFLNTILTNIGKNTLTIMYLHILVTVLYKKIIGYTAPPIIFLLIGIIIPLGLSYIFKTNKITKILLLSDNSHTLFKLQNK